MAIRPRRSAPTSYTHLLQPLELTSSSDEHNDDPRNTGAKKKGKRKAPYIPQDDSGSEFELDRGGKAGSAAAESTSSDDDLASAAHTESDNASQEDEDELSASASASDLGSVRGGRGRGRGRASGGASGRGRAAVRVSTGASAPPSRSLVITTGAVGSSPSVRDRPSRAVPLSNLPPSGLDVQYSSFGPLFVPPSVTLESSSQPLSSSAIKTSTKKGKGRGDGDVSSLLDRATANPFFPIKGLVRDLGWYKGKWTDEGGSQRWGGWFDELELKEGDVVALNEETLAEYLPRQVYHSRPLPYFEVADPTPADPTTERDSSAAPGIAPVDGTGDANDEGPVGQAETRKILVGRINGEDEQEVEIERFSSARLDSFLPNKPGHLLNAGGPVSGLSWLPRTDAPSLQGAYHSHDGEFLPTRAVEKASPDPLTDLLRPDPSSAEYLAISTISSSALPLQHPPALSSPSSRSTSMIQIWLLDTSSPSDLQVETLSSSEDQGAGAKFEMGLCLGEGVGEALEVAWCPRGGSGEGEGQAMDVDGEGEKVQQLGVLASVLTDGTIEVYAVPDPKEVRVRQGKKDGEPVFVKAKRVLKLRLPDTSCVALSYGSQDVIAAGCMNGHIAVWNVGDALRAGRPTVRPTHYLPVHSAPIRSIAFVLAPPPSTANPAQQDFDADPVWIASTGMDGNTVMSDLRESGSAGSGLLLHERSSGYAVAFSPHLGCVYGHDQDDRLRAYFLKPSELGNSKRIGAHRGTVWSLAASPHHTFIASASADGTCRITSGLRALRRRRVRGHFGLKVFKLEFERETGQWRMLDNFHVEQRSALDPYNVSVATKAKSPKTKSDDAPLVSTAAWPLEIGVTRVAWHPNLDRACLLASGMSCGLVRLDWVEGAKEEN
ncbi:hypothetical protein JCM21900_000133 [Sporobolomyces salmonicolor]